MYVEMAVKLTTKLAIIHSQDMMITYYMPCITIYVIKHNTYLKLTNQVEIKTAWVREKSTTFMSTVILRRKFLSLISSPPIHLFDYAFEFHLLFAKKKVHLSTVKYKSVKV